MPDKDSYLGDGVYARYDGSWQMSITEGDHKNEEKRIYLEHDVLRNLVKFAISHGYINKDDII